MALQYWNPMAEVNRIFDEMDRLFTGATGSGRFTPRPGGYRPAIDLYDTGDQLVVKAMLPGVAPENVDVSLEQNVLTISGRYGYTIGEDEAKKTTWYRREIGSGQFTESVTLPVPVDANATEASFDKGILTLTMPKHEQARARRIEVRSPQALADSTH